MIYGKDDKAQDVWITMMGMTKEELQLGDLRETILDYFKNYSDTEFEEEIELL